MERKTYNIDAAGEVLGRLASKIAILLRGKNVPEFEPHIDAGAKVVVANINKIKITGKKISQKEYHSYSGYPGGLKTKKMSTLMKEKPAEVLKKAVSRMLPTNRLKKEIIKRLIIK